MPRSPVVVRTLIALLALALTGCAAHPDTRPPTIQPAPPGLTPARVAERYERAVRWAGPIHVRQTTYENGRPSLSAESWMTHDSLRTDIVERGLLVYSLSVRGSRAQELIHPARSADGTRGPRFEDYTTPTPGAIDYPRLISSSWGCHVGDQFVNWLTSDDRIADVLVARLASSQLVGVADIDTRRCAVIRWEDDINLVNPAEFQQGATYFIDLATGWIVRTDQYQQQGRRRIERTSLVWIEPAAPDPSLFELTP